MRLVDGSSAPSTLAFGRPDPGKVECVWCVFPPFFQLHPFWLPLKPASFGRSLLVENRKCSCSTEVHQEDVAASRSQAPRAEDALRPEAAKVTG